MRTVYIKLRLQFRLIVVFLISIIVPLVQLCKEISPKALPDREELKDYFAEVVTPFFKTATNCWREHAEAHDKHPRGNYKDVQRASKRGQDIRQGDKDKG